MSDLISTPYTTKWLKSKLISHYGDSLVIANMDGCKDVLYLKESANKLLYQFYDEGRKTDVDDEKERIIKLAANLIKRDIVDISCNKNQYFSLNDLDEQNMLSYIPNSLLLMLKHIAPTRSIMKDIKYAAIGQSIVQLARPYSIICPIQVALGIETHHKTGSEFMVQVLHRFGFSSSIKEVRILEKSLCNHNPFEDTLQNCKGNPLYYGDNADVNIGTIDGKNTLHVMGMIRSCISSGKLSDKIIERRFPTTEELRKNLIPISYMNKIEKKLVNVV